MVRKKRQNKILPRRHKERQFNSRTQGERKLSEEEEQMVVQLVEKRVFRIGEIASIFRIPSSQIKKLVGLKEPTGDFFRGVKPERISIVLDERWSLVLKKLVLKTNYVEGKRAENYENRKDKKRKFYPPLINFTPLEVVITGLDLLSWLYGVSTHIGPQTYKDYTGVRVPIPCKFALLRRLARNHGVVPSWHSEKTKRIGQARNTFFRNVCLYYGIDPGFVRQHYDSKGEYWSLRRLKELALMTTKEKKVFGSYVYLRKLLLAHGFVKNVKERYELKIPDRKNS